MIFPTGPGASAAEPVPRREVQPGRRRERRATRPIAASSNVPTASGSVDIAGAGAATATQGGKNGLSGSLQENGPVASQTNPGAVFTQTLGDGVSQHVFTAHASPAAQSEFCVHAVNRSQAAPTPHKAAPDASLKHWAPGLPFAGAASEVVKFARAATGQVEANTSSPETMNDRHSIFIAFNLSPTSPR